MKPEIKQRWVEALRSGKYTQARQRLCMGGGMCCLGVLTDLYLSDVKGAWVDGWFDPLNKQKDLITVDRNNTYLPAEVQTWSGIGGTNPHSFDPDFIQLESRDGEMPLPLSAVTANDSLLLNFSQIADLVERFL